MKHSILGNADDRRQLDKWYNGNKAAFDKLKNGRAIIWKVFKYWMCALLLLFLLFAYRPQITEPPDGFFSGLHVYRSAEAPAASLPLVLENQSGVRDFTEYLARTTGLIPSACAVTESSIQIPLVTLNPNETDGAQTSAERKPNAENAALPPDPNQPVDAAAVAGDATDSGASVAVPPEATTPPLPLRWMLGDDAHQEFGACRWRNKPISIIAFFSPLVGTVQKLTLFLLILGLVLVRKGAVHIDLDSVCFPGRSRSDAWSRTTDKQVELMVHPAFAPKDGKQSGRTHPLYPSLPLILDRSPASEAGIVEYRNDVYSTKIAVGESQLWQPFDLILSVLETGVKHRRVGPMADRIASATFDFRERVSNRLWFIDYILWFLPTIGFLGTIYGISVSLVRAKGLFDEENDFSQVIRQVVDGLGVAFDTTSMALICSAILYLCLRRTEAKIGPLVDRAEETLTELLVGNVEDTPSPTPPSPATPKRPVSPQPPNRQGKDVEGKQGEAGSDRTVGDGVPARLNKNAHVSRRSSK